MYKYLALERGRPGFPQDSVSHGTWELLGSSGIKFRLRGYHFLWPAFPDSSAILFQSLSQSRNPLRSSLRSEVGFRLFRFRSPLTYGISLISFPVPI